MDTEDNIELRDQNPFGGEIKSPSQPNNKIKVIVGIIIVIFVLILIIIVLAFVGKTILLKPAPSWRQSRLPTWQKPLHYDLSFKIDPTQNSFSGSSTINIILTNITTDTIVMSAENLSITSYVLRLVDSEDAFTKDKETQYQNGDQLITDKINGYILIKSEYLKKGRTVGEVKYLQLQIKWNANYQTLNQGIFKSSYLDDKGNTVPFVATYFYPVGARTAFPCFDEPQLIATYSISINTTSDQGTVLSNMPFDSNDITSGMKQVRFQKSPNMATYQVSFIVSNFPSVSKKVGRTTLGVFVPPKLISFANDVANTSSTLFNFYINYFQYNFTLPKLDIVAIPKFDQIAISNPGLIFVRSRDLMNDLNSTTRNFQDTQLAVSHEICHQWFGPVVRFSWWNSAWLFEGLCNFFQYHSVDVLFPDWDIWERFELDRSSAMQIDSLKSTQALELPASAIMTKDNINGVMNDLTSNKATQIIYMSYDRLEAVEVGTFQTAITSFISNYAGKFVDGNIYIKALEDSSSFSVSDFLSNWIYKPGYPFVYFERQTGNTFVAKQSKFYLENPAPTPQSWWISLLVQYESKLSKYYRYKFNQTAQSPPFDENKENSPYLIVNPERIGYYRVLYTPDLLNNISVLLLTEGPDTYEVEDLIGLFDDMLQMSRSNITGFSYPVRNIFDFALLITGSTNPNFWEFIIEMFTQLDILLNDPPSTSQFDKFIRYITKPVYSYVGLNPRVTDSHHEKILRSIVLPFAIAHNVSGSVTPALDLYRKFVSGSISLSPDVQVGIFTAATMFGTAQDFHWLKNRYLTTDSEDEAHRILIALANVGDSTLLNEVLGMFIDKSISSADIVEFAEILSTHNTKDTWNYYKSNWNVISSLYPDQNETLLIEIAENFASSDLYSILNSFISTNRIPMTISLRQCLETVDSNVKWNNVHSRDVDNFMKNWVLPKKQINSNIFFN